VNLAFVNFPHWELRLPERDLLVDGPAPLGFAVLAAALAPAPACVLCSSTLI